jgi:hypothetical protein
MRHTQHNYYLEEPKIISLLFQIAQGSKQNYEYMIEDIIKTEEKIHSVRNY